MPTCRVIKNNNYTTISNYHLRDRELSNKAKGLLTLMLSLPDDWDYTIEGLSRLSSDGRDAIRSTVMELEARGYMVRTQSRGKGGNFDRNEYWIFEEPQDISATPDGDNAVESTEKSVDNVKPEVAKEKRYAEHGNHDCVGKSDIVTQKDEQKRQEESKQNPPLSEKPSPVKNADNAGNICSVIFEKKESTAEETRAKRHTLSSGVISDYPLTENPLTVNPLTENSTQLNTNKQNTNKTNIQIRYDKMRARVREQIEADILAVENGEERVEEIVSLIVEMLMSQSNEILIAGEKRPRSLVEKRFHALTCEHIRYVFDCLKKLRRMPKNIKKYLLAALFNAPSTMDNYITADLHQMQLI